MPSREGPFGLPSLGAFPLQPAVARLGPERLPWRQRAAARSPPVAPQDPPVTRWRRPLPAAERRQRGERWHLSDGRASASHAAPPCKPGTTWARRTCSSRSSTATRASRTAGATSGRRRGSRARSTCHPNAQCAVLALPVLALPVLALPVTAPRLARAWPHPAARGLAPLGLGRCAHSAAEGLACPDTSRSLRPPRPKRAHADGVSRLYRWSCAPRTTSDTTYGPTSTSRSASRCGTGSSAPGLLPREGASSTRRP